MVWAEEKMGRIRVCEKVPGSSARHRTLGRVARLGALVSGMPSALAVGVGRYDDKCVRVVVEERKGQRAKRCGSGQSRNQVVALGGRC